MAIYWWLFNFKNCIHCDHVITSPRTARRGGSRALAITFARSAESDCVGAAISGVCGGRYDWNDRVADQLREMIGDPEHLVFIIADGFGMNFVNTLPEDSFVRRNLAFEGRTAFPPITAANLFALGQGEWPGQHAAIGWYMLLAEIGERATVFPWIRTRDGEDLTVLGSTAESVYPGQSLVPQFSRDSMSLVPSELSASNPSKALHGSTSTGYESPALAIDTAIARTTYSHSTYTHIYWPMIDKSSHAYGTGHENTRRLVKDLDMELRRLHSGLQEDSRLIVIADHGHLNIREDQKFLITPDDPLTKLLAFDVTGDTKTAIFHVKEGAREAFTQQFRTRYGEHFFLFSAKEVAELELLGPDGITDFTAVRLGDFIAVAKGQGAIKFQTPENTRGITQLSEHGGFTPDEMLVPIVIA